MCATKVSVALGIAVFLAGCVTSLHPLFTKENLVFDPALVGTWAGQDGDTWTFEKSGDKAYSLSYYQHEYGVFEKEPGDTAKFQARLGRLEDFRFLYLLPEMPDIKNDLYSIHLLPAHTFSRVWLDEDTLRLAKLDHG